MLEQWSSEASANMATLQTSIATNNGNVAAEQTARENAVANLQTQITSLQQSLAALQSAQNTTASGLAAEVAARTTAVSSEATTRANADTVLQNLITALTARVAFLENYVDWAEIKVLSLPAIAVGATTDVAITWTTAAPDTSYIVRPVLIGTSVSLLGTVTPVLKDNSKTVNGCTISIKNSGLIPVTVNAGQLEVLGLHV